MPVDDRSNRTRRNLPVAGGRQLQFEPIAHVLCALAISSASILLAIWTFSPQASNRFAGASVLAAERTNEAARAGTEVDTSSLSIVPARLPGVLDRPGSGTENAAQEVEPVALRGTVVDAFRRPIPHATLWLDCSPWAIWSQADGAGIFRGELPNDFARELRDGTGSVRIAARAPHHSPSLVQTLDAIPTEDLTFVLEQGGARLRLEVVDSSGQPVAGVRVTLLPAAGNPRLPCSHSLDQEWMPAPIVSTDRWGLLRLDGLAPGEHELRLEKVGYSTRLGQLRLVKGEICSRIIELQKSSQVRGQLLRSDGGPVERATVCATSAETMQAFETLADSEGNYLLPDLPAGSVALVAQSHGTSGLLFEARTQRSLSGGQTEAWSPVLSPVQMVRGRLLDSSGLPLSGWRVETRDPKRVERRLLSTETDGNGAYELPFPGHADLPLVAYFHPEAGRGFPTRIVPMEPRDGLIDPEELEPGESEVARIVGRVLLPSGQPAVGTGLVLQRKQDRIYVPLTIDHTGHFASPPLPPGLYVPVFPQHGLGWTPNQPLRVEGHQQVDLGTFQLPALGKLSVLTSSSNRYTQKLNIALDLLRPGVESGFHLPVLLGVLEVPLELTLAPGQYELSFPGEGMETISFLIEGDVTTLVVLTPPE